MKIFAFIFSVAIALFCLPVQASIKSSSNFSSLAMAKAHSVDSIEVANRKGSTRKGGSNSKGKGSKYVGGKKSSKKSK